jgi:FMN-dependent NADH-azoreductase
MTTLLHLNSSIFSSEGHSSQLATEFVNASLKHLNSTKIIVRDLALDPPPHLDAQRVTAFFTPAEQRTAEQQVFIAESDALIAEIIAADIIVLGLPMYNFGIPSTLKAYLDQIARAGITFRYTETGPVGLLSEKKVYIFASRGGCYAGTPLDSETRYIRDFLGFLGLTDVEIVYAEGLNMGDAVKLPSLASAKEQLTILAANVSKH